MKPVLDFLLISLALMCAPAAGVAAETIHPDTVAPGGRYNDAPNWELGTVFRTTAPGKITHARVFSLADEFGEHLVRIWRNADNTVIAGPIPWTFGGDEAWIALDIPDVSVEANTDYTISVSVGADGWYPANSQYFAAAGDNGAHLAYPPAAGVFSDTLGNRPTQFYGNASYLRDVVFEPEGAFPAIHVLGNGVRIPPGASAPNLADGTQFGGVNVGAGPLARTFTIANPGSASLELTGTPLVALSGAQVGDFSVTAFPAASVPPGGSTTFTVQFAPAASGLRDATVILTNTAGAPLQFAIEGIGMGNDFRLLGNRTATRVLATAPDQVIGSRFMAMRNMRLSQINLQVARLTSSAGNAVLKCAIYGDGGGSSGQLLGTTSELIDPTSGWQALPLTSPVEVSAASNYWLVVWASGEQIELYGDATGLLQWGAYPYGGDWPDPVDLTTGSSANTFCIYAEGIPTDKTGPEMEVQGNGWHVPAGSADVTSADGTDFGAAMLHGGTRVSTFTILNVGQGSLALSGAPAATVVGPHANEFTDPGALSRLQSYYRVRAL